MGRALSSPLASPSWPFLPLDPSHAHHSGEWTSLPLPKLTHSHHVNQVCTRAVGACSGWRMQGASPWAWEAGSGLFWQSVPKSGYLGHNLRGGSSWAHCIAPAAFSPPEEGHDQEGVRGSLRRFRAPEPSGPGLDRLPLAVFQPQPFHYADRRSGRTSTPGLCSLAQFYVTHTVAFIVTRCACAHINPI